MAGKSTATININLDNSECDKAFSGNEIIHREEMEYLSTLISGKINKNNLEESKNIFNTIFVNGKRGTGKSSFIKTFKSILESDGNSVDDFYVENFKSAEVLEILDPTLIEDKVHIFITIISLIKSVVDQKFNRDLTKNFDIYSKKDWEKSLEKLSEGLPFIDGVNKANPAYWDDSWQIFRKGISSANAAFNLKKNFEEFVSKSLAILGKTTFILFIDDVDTDFSKSFPLLETLRKYLSTNKIITILTGDLDLLATSVRKRQWENFDKPLLINEADKTAEDRNKYNKSVTELVEQYLLKVLPAKNRIRLRTLKEIGDEKIEVKYDGIEKEQKPENETDKTESNASNGRSLKNFIEMKLKDYGIENAYQRKAFTDLIYSLLIRTQIEFFRFLNDSDITRLNDIFYAELWKNNININDITLQPEFLCSSILKYLVDNRKLNEFYQLQPISSVEEENIILLVFTLCFSKLVKDNPKLIFDFFIKIGYMRNLLLKYPYESIDSNGKEANKNFKELLRISSFFENNELRQQVCYSVAFQRSFYKKTSLFDALSITDDSFKNIVEAGKINPIVLLPVFYTTSNSSGKSVRNYSFFALIGAIFDLISETDSGVSFENAILRITQVRTYSGAENSEEQDDNTDDELEKLTVDKDKLETLTSLFATWKESLKEIKIAPYSISKISTRICNAFENIVSKNRNNNLAEIMNLLVCEFFNAVLIEESLEKDFGEKISRNNIVNSTKVFTDNLKSVTQESDLPLTNAIISCPILLCYVENDVLDKLTGFLGESVIKSIKTLSLYANLKDINLFENPKDNTKSQKQNSSARESTDAMTSELSGSEIDNPSSLNQETSSTENRGIAGADESQNQNSPASTDEHSEAAKPEQQQ